VSPSSWEGETQMYIVKDLIEVRAKTLSRDTTRKF